MEQDRVSALVLRPCSSQGCPRRGRWEPTLHLYPEGHNREKVEPCQVKLGGLLLCDHCRARAIAEDVIEEEDWVQIKIGFANAKLYQPCRETMFLTFAPPEPPGPRARRIS